MDKTKFNDFWTKISGNFFGFIDNVIFIVVIFAIATLILKWISGKTKRGLQVSKGDSFDEKNVSTGLTLFRSGARYFVYIIATIICISHIGFQEEVASAIVAAGVGGLILTLGTQSIVKDVISGLTIAFEKPYLVGDYIKVGEFEGTVKAIAMKSTYLDYYGQRIVIPNGNISNIINYSREVIEHEVLLAVPVKVPLKKAENALDKAIETIYRRYETDLETKPVYKGLGTSSGIMYELSVFIIDRKLNFWAIERELKREFRNEIDKTIGEL